MANTFNYAEQWQPQLLQIITDGTYTSPFITTNVSWLNAKTFHFTHMSVGGLKNHNRAGGWNRGEFTQKDVPYTLEHDRDIEFLVDKADVDETNKTASIQNIAETLTQTQTTPETDARFFEKVSEKAVAEDRFAENAESVFTKANVFTKLHEIINRPELQKYKARGALILYVSTYIMGLLKLSSEIQKTIELTSISDSGLGIRTNVISIDGVPIMEVIDSSVFNSKFDYTSGFVANGRKINVLAASQMTCKTVHKINSIYMFAPGEHTQGDGWLYQYRAFWDTFIFPNGKDGEYDSIYADLQPVA